MSDSSDGLTERQMPDGREKRWRATTPAKRSAAFNRDNMWDRKETLLKEIGEIGVSAMQISVVDDSHLIIIDKKEDNPLKDINGNPAWGSIYNFKTKKERPLNMITNSFCAGGSWLGNGTLINVGGDIGDTGGDGYQSVRLFTPCPDGKECDIVDDPEGVRMAARRWYASTARIGDGSVLIMGGSNAGAYINSKWVTPRRLIHRREAID